MKRDHFHILLSFDGEQEIPEWIHLLPAGEIRPYDGRKSFRVEDAEVVIAASSKRLPLPVDQDHATDLVKETGTPAPARGWITELQARPDGIWGKVDWTPTGKALLRDRAYRGISPVVTLTKKQTVVAVLRAALTNDPALDQLTTVFSGDTQMDWKEKLAVLLGLKPETSDEDILAALEKALKTPETVAMSAEPGTPAAEQATALAAANAEIATLKGTVGDLKTEIATLAATGHHDKAVQAIDDAIKAGKPIKPQRDTWIGLYAADPEKTAAALEAMPVLNGDAIDGGDEDASKVTLSAEEAEVAKMMGLSRDKFLAARQEDEE